MFPISQHNNLQVALGNLKLGVEPIPLNTLAAASLIIKRESRYQNLEFMEKANLCHSCLRIKILALVILTDWIGLIGLMDWLIFMAA